MSLLPRRGQQPCSYRLQNPSRSDTSALIPPLPSQRLLTLPTGRPQPELGAHVWSAEGSEDCIRQDNSRQRRDNSEAAFRQEQREEKINGGADHPQDLKDHQYPAGLSGTSYHGRAESQCQNGGASTEQNENKEGSTKKGPNSQDLDSSNYSDRPLDKHEYSQNTQRREIVSVIHCAIFGDVDEPAIGRR